VISGKKKQSALLLSRDLNQMMPSSNCFFAGHLYTPASLHVALGHFFHHGRAGGRALGGHGGSSGGHVGDAPDCCCP